MARRRSQKNKKTKQNKEVTLEILLPDCSNYDSWSTRVINAFMTIDPQLEQILDKSIIPSNYARENASEEDLRCIRLNYLAYDILSHPGFGAPRPRHEHNHQVCWDQVSHI
jgi:hypothetical protein